MPLLDAAVQTLAPAVVPGVATEQSLSSVLDVIVVLGPGGVATLTLADGTVLTATRLAADEGNPGALATVVDATCARCGASDTSGAVKRVRLTGELSGSSTVQLKDVRVSSSGGPMRRVRWEVLEL